MSTDHHRETQVDAYRQIVAGGLLSRMRLEAYRLVFENQEPCGVTGGELDRLFSSLKNWSRGASPRLNELVKLDALEEMEPRECRQTGMRVIAYRTTGRLPKDAATLKTHTIPMRHDLQLACALLREPLIDDEGWNRSRLDLLRRHSASE